MAIFALISVITFQGLQGMMKSRAIMDAETARLAALQGAMALMARDFQQMIARPIRDEFGDVQPAVICTVADGTTIEFSRGGWRNPAALARSTMQRVAYHLTGSTLIRETWPVLDRTLTTEPVSRELVAGVFIFACASGALMMLGRHPGRHRRRHSLPASRVSCQKPWK